MGKPRDDYRLIPYRIEAIEQKVDEVPPGVRMIEAPSMWEQGQKGEGIVVAILDTGCQTDHPELKDRIIGGINFTTDYGDVNNFEDNNGHGTHVAGTIAALDNGVGIVGVAPRVKLLILKVLTGTGSGSYAWITDAIKYATNWRGKNGERVRVINMSLGGPDDNAEMHNAIKEAILSGISVVVAAGNEGDANEDSFEYSYPGNYNEVIEVGAVDLNKKLASFSNNNDQIDVVAPGVGILSTWPGSKYATLSGTSMATPHVAGAIALLIAQAEKDFGRTMTEAEHFALLVQRCISIGYRKSSEGHGLVQLDFANRLRKLQSFIEANFRG